MATPFEINRNVDVYYMHADLKCITSVKSFDIIHFWLVLILTIPTTLHLPIVLNWHTSVRGKVRSIIIEPFLRCTVASTQQVCPLLNNNCRKWIQLKTENNSQRTDVFGHKEHYTLTGTFTKFIYFCLI